MWNKLLRVEIVRSDKGTYNLGAYLNVDKYNIIYPDNYLTTVWPEGESLYNVKIKVVRNDSLVQFHDLVIEYDIEIDDIKPELFDIRDFLYMKSFYSIIYDADTIIGYDPSQMHLDERSFFKGLGSKLFCYMLGYIKNDEPDLKYITLRASAQNTDELVNKVYTPLGFRNVLTKEAESIQLEKMMSSRIFPMYSEIDTVMYMCKTHICSFCGSMNAKYYCGDCFLDKYCDVTCQMKYTNSCVQIK